MKKMFASVLAVMMLACALALPAAAEAPVSDAPAAASPRAEELEWVFRYYNGKYQCRLWSHTYGVWRTDWIDM